MRPYRIYLYLEPLATQRVSSGLLLPVRLCLNILGSSSESLIRESARIRPSFASVPYCFAPAPSVGSCARPARATLPNLIEMIGAHKHPCGSRRPLIAYSTVDLHSRLSRSQEDSLRNRACRKILTRKTLRVSQPEPVLRI